MKYHFTSVLFLFSLAICAQLPDHVYKQGISSVKLYNAGNIYSYPIIKLNSPDELVLQFDDLDDKVKNYYYSFQLCNADWQPANLHPLDYIRGFQSIRITQYRNSSIAFTRYTNYYARVPDKNCMPTRSGNYLLKVFLDGDTAKLAFTKRFLVVETKSSTAAIVTQPFNGSIFKTHQKLQVSVNINPEINVFNYSETKVVLLQNYCWTTALYQQRPTIVRGNYFEYSDEAKTSFPAGKEWRWIDLRSLRLMSERMQRLDKQPTRTDVYIKPDAERSTQIYFYYDDINGRYTIESSDNINPFWQSDYAYVHFTYFPPGNRPYPERDLYVFGELTDFETNENSKMIFNDEKGAYEKTLFLKQGFYNYSYVTVSVKNPDQGLSIANTEGNYSSTENAYLILVYYRPFGGKADELIGYSLISSLLQNR
jgi:hypothetical protein